jgi:hypothetical protein
VEGEDPSETTGQGGEESHQQGDGEGSSGETGEGDEKTSGEDQPGEQTSGSGGSGEDPVVKEEIVQPPPQEEVSEATQPNEETKYAPVGDGSEASGHSEPALNEEDKDSTLTEPVSETVIAPTELSAAGTTGQTDLIAPIVGAPEEPPPPSGAAAVETRLSAAKAASSFGCELAELGGLSGGDCGASWLATPTLISASGETLATAATALAPTAALAPTGGDDGGSAVIGNRPSGPTPGPAPGGGSGASSAGGSGLAPSAFLTLAALLLLAAPHAMRRLRLSGLPWRTAFFVLIPERPG